MLFKIHIEVYLEEPLMFIETYFRLNEFVYHTSFLKYITIGTQSWILFYQMKDYHYGLFVREYYVIFHKIIGDPSKVSMLGTICLTDSYLTMLRISFVEGKVFLEKMEQIKNSSPITKK